MNDVKLSGKRLAALVPCLWLALGLALMFFYLLLRGREMLDSDMAAEMVLSDLLNKEHAVLTTSWYYSTEIRFLNMQWLFRLGLLLFPGNWHWARLIGTTLGVMILAASVLVLFRAMRQSRAGLWAAALATFPGGSWYFGWTIFGGHYIPHVCIPVLALALFLMAVEYGTGRRYLVLLVMNLLLAFAAGINGVKQMMVFYAPLWLAAVGVAVYEMRRVLTSGGSAKAVWRGYGSRGLLLSILVCTANLAGYLVNSCILANIYRFADFNDRMITNDGSFLLCMKWFIWSFGFSPNKELLSFGGLASICGVIFGCLVILCGIRLLLRFDRLSPSERQFVATVVTAVLFCAFVYSYVKGSIFYFIPVLPLSLGMVVLDVQTGSFVTRHGRFISMNLAVALFVLTSVGTMKSETNRPLRRFRAQMGISKAVEWLGNEGYSRGVSHFWTSPLITELSDGKIEMWTLDYDNTNWTKWLHRTGREGKFPESPYFYLYRGKPGERKKHPFLDRHPELKQVYSDGRFTIFGTGNIQKNDRKRSDQLPGN